MRKATLIALVVSGSVAAALAVVAFMLGNELLLMFTALPLVITIPTAIVYAEEVAKDRERNRGMVTWSPSREYDIRTGKYVAAARGLIGKDLATPEDLASLRNHLAESLLRMPSQIRHDVDDITWVVNTRNKNQHEVTGRLQGVK